MPGKSSVVFLNIPPQFLPPLKRVVNSALKRTRRYFYSASRPLAVAVCYDPNPALVPKKSDLYAYPLTSRFGTTLMIWLSLKLLAYDKQYVIETVGASVVHELVHAQRKSAIQKLRVIDSIVEEGLACFVEAQLFRPPVYLDLGKVRVEHLRKFWRRLRPRFSQRLPGAKGALEVPVVNYQIGYYIVSEYAAKKPRTSLNSLVRMPRSTFISLRRRPRP